MERIASTMMEMIECAIMQRPLSADTHAPLTEEELTELYRTAKRQDMAHLIGYVLDKNHLLTDSETSAKFKKQVPLALYRYGKLDFELQRICRVLELEKIPYMPLKGSVIRAYYPEPWMRTSCDIDVLVRDEDVDRAAQALSEQLAYRVDERKDYHDISLYSAGGVHLELHFSIKEHMDTIDGLLEQVWQYAAPVEDGSYHYLQTKEYLLFHHIAHMSYHFVRGGGCGVKPLVDLYLLKHRSGYDEATVRAYCRACRLERFYDSVLALSEVWFGRAEHTDVTRKLQTYIFAGGVYGTMENKVVLQQGVRGGRSGYALSRIFLPYHDLKDEYPILGKHKWLLPVMEVRRWFRIVRSGRWKRSRRELSINQAVSKEQADTAQVLLRDIGLES